MRTILLTCLLLLPVNLIAGKPPKVVSGHTHDILTVKFSPDDRQLLSYSGADKLILWDVKSGDLLWTARTELVQIADEQYALVQFHWSEDGKLIVTKSHNGTYQTWDAETGRILAVSETSPDIPLNAGKASQVSVSSSFTNGASVFSLSNAGTGETFTVPSFSRTATVYAVTSDGSLFAEGGSWGNAAIRITELATRKSWLLDGRLTRQPAGPDPPGELETRLNSEKWARRAALDEAKARLDKQAAIDARSFKKQVYITFEHYGDMTDPGELRMTGSDEPNLSRLKRSAADANAIWLPV